MRSRQAVTLAHLDADVDAVVRLEQRGAWVVRRRAQRYGKRQARDALLEAPSRRNLAGRVSGDTPAAKQTAGARASTTSLSSGTGRTLRKNASKTPTARSLTRICTEPDAATLTPPCCTGPDVEVMTTSPSSLSPAWYTRSDRESLTSIIRVRRGGKAARARRCVFRAGGHGAHWDGQQPGGN